jgi:hypothetical protein
LIEDRGDPWRQETITNQGEPAWSHASHDKRSSIPAAAP